MRKVFLAMFLCVCCCSFGFPVYAMEDTGVEVVDHETSVKQYYKLCVDDNENMYMQKIEQDDFQIAVQSRSAVYAEGWEVTTISGYTAAYVTLYYQTVESGGKKVFDLSNTYFECTEMNGYVGALEILQGTVHSFQVKYEYLNLFGEGGYRQRWFYPQQ